MSAVNDAGRQIDVVLHSPLEDISPADIIDTFLDAMDPQILEARALDRMGWGDEGTLTAKILEVLREAARGLS